MRQRSWLSVWLCQYRVFHITFSSVLIGTGQIAEKLGTKHGDRALYKEVRLSRMEIYNAVYNLHVVSTITLGCYSSTSTAGAMF